MGQEPDSVLEMAIHGLKVEPLHEGYAPVTLHSNRGDVQCRHYPAANTRLGAVWVGGAGGGWDSPAHGLYVRLCQGLVERGIASLRVRYRIPNDLEECTLDVLAGLAYLESEGVAWTALTGHSFGGAVAIQAAAAWPGARTVVALSTQSYGADPVASLAPRCSLLLIHGGDDKVLPAAVSEHVYNLAQEPKRVIIYSGAGHGLDEVAGPLEQVLREWIPDQLHSAPEQP